MFSYVMNCSKYLRWNNIRSTKIWPRLSFYFQVSWSYLPWESTAADTETRRRRHFKSLYWLPSNQTQQFWLGKLEFVFGEQQWCFCPWKTELQSAWGHLCAWKMEIQTFYPEFHSWAETGSCLHQRWRKKVKGRFRNCQGQGEGCYRDCRRCQIFQGQSAHDPGEAARTRRGK